MITTFITLPLIAAFIGWITNWVAVKMLFHPRKEINFLFFRIQGVFPKRQKALARKLGEIVSEELFSIEDVKEKLVTKASSVDLNPFLEEHFKKILTEKLPTAMPMLAMFLNSELVEKIQGLLLANTRDLVASVVTKIVSELEDSVDVKTTVQERVENFSSEKLEQILYEIMSREFKFIEIIGGVLGFIIGVIQVVIVRYLEN